MAIKEYRDIKPGEMSVVEALDSRTIKNDYGKVSIWTLKHHTAGWECAGSCARATVERWSVTTFDRSNSTTHGNSFLSLADALKVFHSDKPWYAPPPSAREAASALVAKERANQMSTARELTANEQALTEALRAAWNLLNHPDVRRTRVGESGNLGNTSLYTAAKEQARKIIDAVSFEGDEIKMSKARFTTMSHAELCQAKRTLEVNMPAMTAQGRACGERDLKNIEALLVSLEDGSRSVAMQGASVVKHLAKKGRLEV